MFQTACCFFGQMRRLFRKDISACRQDCSWWFYAEMKAVTLILQFLMQGNAALLLNTAVS